MTVDEAMEEFRKIVTSHPVNLCDCDTCDGWLPKVRHLFREVQGDAFRRGWNKALDFVNQELGSFPITKGGEE